MQIFIKTLTGRTLTLEIANEDIKFVEIKQEILDHHLTSNELEAMNSTSVDNLAIIIEGKEADNNKTIKEHMNAAGLSSIRQVETIHLIINKKKLISMLADSNSFISGNQSTLLSSRYQQLPLDQRQYLSETTQFVRHAITEDNRHPSTETYFNSLTKKEQDSLLAGIDNKTPASQYVIQ